MRAWNQLSNTIIVTSGQQLSHVTVVNGHMGETHTQRWNTNAVHDILRFRYQRMNITMLYDLVILYTQICIRKCNIMFLRALNVGVGLQNTLRPNNEQNFLIFEFTELFSLGLKGTDLFMTPCAGVLVLRRAWLNKSYNENALFL